MRETDEYKSEQSMEKRFEMANGILKVIKEAEDVVMRLRDPNEELPQYDFFLCHTVESSPKFTAKHVASMPGDMNIQSIVRYLSASLYDGYRSDPDERMIDEVFRIMKERVLIELKRATGKGDPLKDALMALQAMLGKENAS